ncbi:MAG: type IV pilin N-terminal domain-containing protein [Methanoregula sp.]|jgi:FlaG/FlaF family flagellin (archaellin)|uniref:type IV pilin N-terminal domain-containing protein n=1 Tax=Methanoregula sp. TaxID=2052170 RepID=UPI0025ECBC28|nr:type IV pilin N-terminal domain-containing protein [Methanoregula sp.]MCK9630629.1 type IV pilin N-terminal domain-containing protein [Methanoregula sp.]
MKPAGWTHADAVSPVVGVMLMLAVTVMVAAIVSTYAGGFSGGTDKTPQSSLRATPNLLQDRIYFEHNGGDPFMLSSVRVVLRANENTTSFSINDAGSTLVRNFTEVGNKGSKNDTTIQAGDNFFIEGYDLDSHSGIKFGSMYLRNNTRITWLIVDKETSKSISTGTFYL